MHPKRSTKQPPHHLEHDSTKCVECLARKDIVIPDHLMSQLTERKVVVFAGAGVSTEAKTVFPWTFYDEIHDSLNLPQSNRPAFPKLMSLFCQRPDGRRELVEKIRSRLAYVGSFPELYRTATRFHRELATLFYIDTYVTTNWDDYFERECGATAFVTAEDFAFWQTAGRKVFKLHGSVSSFGSIVATDEDYRRAQRQLQRGTLGAALKLMLATKTILYIGYSLSDYDFLNIHRYISSELKRVAPVAYIVSLDRSAEAKFKSLGITPIFTDGTYFLEVLKKHLKADKHWLPDSKFLAVPLALARAKTEHSRLHGAFTLQATPEVAYCAAYQDGLIHSFERVLSRLHAGDYSHKCEIEGQLMKYESIRRDNLRSRRYIDVAYIEGYMNGLVYLLADIKERKHMPFYFVYGLDGQPTTLAQYKRAIRKPAAHKAARALATRVVRERLGPADELHHTPFLTWKVEAE